MKKKHFRIIAALFCLGGLLGVAKIMADTSDSVGAPQIEQPSTNSTDKMASPNYDQKDALVELKTTMGDIVVELYNDTPLHRDNFLKLVKDGFYD